MNEWEAKYKALAAGVDDPKLVENAEKLPKDLFGFPVESADWLPANKVMIFGSFGAIITDLQTGKSKAVSKEDLEKILRNITGEGK